MTMKIEIDFNILIKFIAGAIGSHCEIVIHDLSNVSKSVVAIENGHITGRKIGSPATNLALKKIKSIEQENIEQSNKEPFLLNYRGRAENGTELRSSTLIIFKNSKPKYMLCLNIDDSSVKNAISMLKASIPGYEVAEAMNENFYNSIEDVSNNIIEQAQKELNITALSRLSLSEKHLFVKTVEKSGLFTIKGNMQKVSKILDISDQTLYRYLQVIE